MLVTKDDYTRVEVLCSLMDLTSLGSPGDFQVEAYVPSNRSNRWLLFTLNSQGSHDYRWVEPLWPEWLSD